MTCLESCNALGITLWDTGSRLEIRGGWDVEQFQRHQVELAVRAFHMACKRAENVIADRFVA